MALVAAADADVDAVRASETCCAEVSRFHLPASNRFCLALLLISTRAALRITLPASDGYPTRLYAGYDPRRGRHKVLASPRLGCSRPSPPPHLLSPPVVAVGLGTASTTFDDRPRPDAPSSGDPDSPDHGPTLSTVDLIVSSLSDSWTRREEPILAFARSLCATVDTPTAVSARRSFRLCWMLTHPFLSPTRSYFSATPTHT